MSTSIIIASSVCVGALGYTALCLHNHICKRKRSKEDQIIRQQSVDQIIRSIYIHVNTKENMEVMNQMCDLNCLLKEQILKPYNYTLKTGGKRIRLIMAVVVSEMFIGKTENIPKEVLKVGALIELLHSASLIIDDIEDGSLERRGKACSYLVHGIDSSINAANLMYFLPFRKLYDSIGSSHKKVEILKIFLEEMTISHMGQAQDIQVHKLKKQNDLPQFSQYQSLTIAKTGSLLRMMVRMLCVILNRTQQQSQSLSQIMNYVGLAFQVTDDVLNLTNNLGKGELAEDLKQKKFTPIINHMREDKEFIEKFIKESKSEDDLQWMLERIKSSNALSSAKQIATTYKDRAYNLIQQLDTPYSKERFQKLMMFIITRQN